MDSKKIISFLLIISLLVPSFIIFSSSTPLQAQESSDNLELRSNINSVLKGLTMFFVLTRLMRGGDSTELEEQESSSTPEQEEPIEEEEPPQDEAPSEEEEDDDQQSDYEDSDQDEEPIVEDPVDEEETSTEDWTEMQVTALTAKEEEMLDLVNQEREAEGLTPLQVDLRLVKVARAKSKNMIEEGYFGHQSPSLGSPFEMMQEIGIRYEFAGENIAGASTVQRAHQALMDSPGHRENILRDRFTHIGIGIIEGGPYGMMFSQEFIDQGRFAN
ncbi:CAP domain-containing protein [Fuchsiella alkaliacetigena]|uniref:CAP domain-containing protein n=1 Tax=Fuchsiella alkaliacetigena TaxID=957042 RepID=UPI00200A154D|nr:CAP domain-containing protein [Fuchsiella alkaliacetigena]